MAKIDDEILAYLQQAARRDAEKGGDGWRSTSEVTDRLGRGRMVVYRRLEKLNQTDLCDCSHPVDIGGNLWRITEAGRRALQAHASEIGETERS